jgi:hypothetical protein
MIFWYTDFRSQHIRAMVNVGSGLSLYMSTITTYLHVTYDTCKLLGIQPDFRTLSGAGFRSFRTLPTYLPT